MSHQGSSPAGVSQPSSVMPPSPPTGLGDSPSPSTQNTSSSTAKEKIVKPTGLCRVFNPPKLEKKHSSGDLISRLKTRKILGVGETDNGDIHRSKISQVLGHNEHLYVKLPRGYWMTHIFLGMEITLEAVLFLFAPSLVFYFGLIPRSAVDQENSTSAVRFAGAALFGIVVFLWALVGTNDKQYARTVLMAIFSYHGISTTLLIGAAFTQGTLGGACLVMNVFGRAFLCLVCVVYFHTIGEPGSGFRKSSSFRNSVKDDPKVDPKQADKPCDSPSTESEDKKEN